MALFRIFFASFLLLLMSPLLAMAAAGDLDTSFDPGSGPSYSVYTAAVQADGKVIVGGDFTSVDGVERTYLARVNTDGSVDDSFNPGAAYPVDTITVQTDGRIIFGGWRLMRRLQADGSIDNSFNLPGSGLNEAVYTSAMQADGKIIIGGYFTRINHNLVNNRIARLNADGSVDGSLNTGAGANGAVWTSAVQADGKILIGGDFGSFNGTTRNHIAQLNTDGSLDSSFNPGTGVSSSVMTIVLQADGKILIGGDFTSFNGVARNRIARLNADGSLDSSFNPGTGASGYVATIALQADGKVLIGGDFTSFNGTTRNRIARLNADGSLDSSFNPGAGASNHVETIVLQADGKILIGGDFTSFNGTTRNRIARIHTGDNDGDGIQDAADKFPFDSTEWYDSDNDGVGNNADMDDDNDTVSDVGDNCPLIINVDQTNTDGDAQGDICDADDDNDGVEDPLDNLPLHFAASVDADLDGSPNEWNAVCDLVCQASSGLTLDNCPATSNVDQLNTDGDGQGNVCDTDDDNDSLLDVGDNCPLISNANQLDSDNDTQGDVCDVESFVPNTGTLDTSFNPSTGAENYFVHAIAVQADGKIIIGGNFTAVNGVAINRIARMNADGSLDSSFNPGAGASSYVWTVAVQMDGKIIMGGDFTTVNGVARNHIARLNADGSLDSSFNPGTGTDSYVYSSVVQADGKIIMGGAFTTVNGVARNHIARLNADGSLDSSFNPGTGANSIVRTIALQANGKIIIGGYFTTVNGVARNRIARLDADGFLDGSFNPGTGANDTVETSAVQADGKIIIGGWFITVNGVARNRIARLNTNGYVDWTFNPGQGANDQVFTIAVQADGKIIIGGQFTRVNNVAINCIARLNADGSLDSSFNLGPNTSGSIHSSAVQADGKIIIGGDFGWVSGIARNRIARIHSGDADGDGIQDAADIFPYDADNDGMPDIWEITYGLNPLANDGGDDMDMDGFTNLQEYTNATDPTVADNSYFPDNDFNNDGTADLLIRSSSGSNWRLFNMSGGVSTANSAYAAYTSAAWQLVASEDFDNDGDTDILLRNTSTGAWRMFITENGAVQSDSNFGAYANTAWEVASVADYNGDGTKDILLHSNAGGGWRVFYITNGVTTSNASMALYASGWDLKYDGDMDGDGDADIILRRASDGYWRQFTVAGGVVASNSATGLYQSLDWQIQFASDLDNDGDDDMVMRNMVSGFNWRTFAVSSGAVGANSKLSMYENAAWSFNHLNDVDADGDDDIVLRSNTGGWRLFITDGLNTPANSALALYANSAWVKADVVDVNGDGTKDVILNNTSSGAWRAFMINGGVVSSDTNPGLYQNTDWTLQNK